MSVVERTGAEGALGVGRPRVDATWKVKGSALYGADRDLPRLLHARLVLAYEPHARILSVDASAALARPGVHAVLTAGDLPTVGAGGTRVGEPLAREEVVFAGQPVAIVLADSEAEAEDGAELVVVELEPLEAVLDPERALEPGAPAARLASPDGPARLGAGLPLALDASGPNLVDANTVSHGDVDSAFAEAGAVVGARFATHRLYQGYLEPQAAVAWPEGDGGVAVRASTQSVFYVRELLARTYGLPLEKVRVEAAVLGGGFGGKLGIVESLAAGSVLATGRAVRLVFTRSEDFLATNPAPAMLVDVQVGAGADGRLSSVRGRVLLDAGANADMSPAAAAGTRLNGFYRWDAWDVETIAVRTNHVGSGAYRAPAAPQSAFALESCIDELAQELGVDAAELRIASCAEAGDLRFNGMPWPEFGAREVLSALRDHPLWQARAELPRGDGVGLAAGVFPGNKMAASAVCRLDEDGCFTLVTGYVDMSGTGTAAVALAAEVLGVTVDRIRLVEADSSAAPRSGVSGGSMVTYCMGSAVVDAARDAREQLLEIAALELEAAPEELEIAAGAIRRTNGGDDGVTIAAIAQQVAGFGTRHRPVEGHGRALPDEPAPGAAAALVHVRVDPETGETAVLRYVAAQDVGRALNPQLCEGQMIGAAVQALGIALYEAIEYDDVGQPLTTSFVQYAVPRSFSVPPIETILVEVPAPHGPFGARPVGEAAIISGAAAVANAIAAATGVRMRELPITGERLWTALAARG